MSVALAWNLHLSYRIIIRRFITATALLLLLLLL